MLRTTIQYLAEYKYALLGAVLAVMLVPLSIFAASQLIITPYKRYILSSNTKTHEQVGLVLGAGITKDGKPYRELKARLDIAADAYNRGTVKQLILSGDNRRKSYDEPTAMYNYLTQTRHVPARVLHRDYAGRSTYESCERASKIFGVKKTIIFSAESHLPRAIYLCRHFGIETYGIGTNVEFRGSDRRELLANVKAVYNANISGERTVLGKPIHI